VVTTTRLWNKPGHYWDTVYISAAPQQLKHVLRRGVADLGGKWHSVDGVFWSGAVGHAEVHDELADSVLVGQRTGAHVHVVQARVVDDQSNVVTSVDESSARLHNKYK